MELNGLPDELLLEIFSRLSVGSLNDLFRLILTCKRWHRLLWSKDFFRRMTSFKYQSRFLIYHYSINHNLKQNTLHKYLDLNSFCLESCLSFDVNTTNFKQDIINCPLINTTISMWCRTSRRLYYFDSTILLLWHYHLGYVGFYRTNTDDGCAMVKCTYTQQHQLNTKFSLNIDDWYHVAIVIREKKDLELYINGIRVGQWALQEKLNKQDLDVAASSSIWLASHCGGARWEGSLFDISLWNRCLQPYELKEMARTRQTIEKIGFIPPSLL